jgi:hypothetical protein
VLRVAIFGDSFTFGDEVRQDETWGAALERGLGARGIDAEVLNFGVNAYGIDQAYLRWQHVGRHYRPHVVVLGFQPEDVLRNLNVFRPLYFMDSEVPLSKPRFVVRDGALTLVNQPTIPPARMRAALAAIRAEPLVPYERFFAPHASPWWMRDRVAATLATLVADVRAKPFHLDEEARELANRIVDAFADDVHAAGAAFLIVHLPRRADLTTLRDGRALWYDALLRDLDARHVIVRPEGEMPAEDAALFAPHGHYLPFTNALVGASLVDVTRRAGAPRTVSASRPAWR